MKSKYAVFLSIMMSLVLIASVIGCSSTSTTSATTSVVPPTTTGTTSNPPTTTTSNPPTTTTTTPPTTTTTTPPTSSTPPPSTYKLLPGQTILKTASSTIAQPMLHLIVGFEGCVNCHWPGKPGALDPKNGVLHLVSPGHHCDECHPSGYGLTPYIGNWDRELMVKSKVTDEETDTSCTVKNCHQPLKP